MCVKYSGKLHGVYVQFRPTNLGVFHTCANNRYQAIFSPPTNRPGNEARLHDTAASIFASAGVKATPVGRPYLGAAIGSPYYISSHVETKVTEWAAILRRLAEIASTQPHAAFSALTHGLMRKWTYLSRTIPGIGPALRLLDLGSAVIPALTGRPPPGDLERTATSLLYQQDLADLVYTYSQELQPKNTTHPYRSPLYSL